MYFTSSPSEIIRSNALVTSTIAKKIVRVDMGVLSVEYEVGATPTAQSYSPTVSGISESVGSSGPAGTTSYNELTNKPSIEGVTLVGNKTFPQLGIFIDSDDDMDGYPDSDMYALTVQDINALWNGGL